MKNKNDVIDARKQLLKILAAGLFAVILHYTLTYVGLTMIESSKTSLLKKSGVLLYMLFAGLFIPGERLTPKKLLGAILGFGGIAVMNISSLGIEFNMGTLFVLCASLCTVISNIISKNVVKSVSPTVQTGLSQLFGGIVLTAAGLIMGGNMSVEFKAEELSFVYICIASVLSYCIWFGMVKKSTLSRLFIIQFAEPVFAAMFGALLLKENILGLNYLLAFVMIFFGIYIANKEAKKA